MVQVRVGQGIIILGGAGILAKESLFLMFLGASVFSLLISVYPIITLIMRFAVPQ